MTERSGGGGPPGAHEDEELASALRAAVRALRDEAAGHRWSTQRAEVTDHERQRKQQLAEAADSAAARLLAYLEALP